MKELLLAGFNTFSGSAATSVISANVKPYNINVKTIPVSDYNMPVGALLSDPTFLSDNFLTGRVDKLAEEAKKAGSFTGPEFENRFIIMCNIERKEIDKVLDILSESGVTKDDIKAVLTPVNSCFSVLQLANELIKEHTKLSG